MKAIDFARKEFPMCKNLKVENTGKKYDGKSIYEIDFGQPRYAPPVFILEDSDGNCQLVGREYGGEIFKILGYKNPLLDE